MLFKQFDQNTHTHAHIHKKNNKQHIANAKKTMTVFLKKTATKGKKAQRTNFGVILACSQNTYGIGKMGVVHWKCP